MFTTGMKPGEGAFEMTLSTQHFAGSVVVVATMNFPKIGAQGYSLGSLHLNSDEFVWTSADKSRYEPGHASHFYYYSHSCSISRTM